MRRVTACVVLLAAVGILAAAGQAPSGQPARQQPEVTFKVEVNYVEVDAIVTDASGRLVRDLSKDDFIVLEDGRPQQISVFALVDIPVERGERPAFRESPVEPDVRTNARPFDGRIFVLVLDDLHTHPLRSALVKRAARAFVERYVGANDLVAVVSTSGRRDVAQEFTTNRRLLLEAIDRFTGSKTLSVTLAKIEEFRNRYGTPLQEERLTDPLEAERGYMARSTLETLAALAEYLSGVRGRRKAIVFFSEGIDYDIHDPFNNPSASTIVRATQDLLAAATRANVQIYAVDPRGLTMLGEEAIQVTGMPPEAPIELGTTGLMTELRLAQDSLRVLADETGGFAVVNTNDFPSAYERILEETSTYYVLGYYPENDKRDGKFRTIEVRVKRPGLHVRARRGYVAPSGRARARAVEAASGTSAPLRAALESPVPVSGLTLRAFAAPFKGTPPNASVVLGIEVPGGALSFAERGGRYTNELEVSFVAIDDRGTVRAGDRKSVTLDLRPQTYRAVATYGVKLISRVALPPGRYQLRIAAREATGGRVGSLHYDLVVPNFLEPPLAMSGVLLTSAGASRTPPAAEDPTLKTLLPAQPTTWREFVSADRLALYVEIYDNRGNTPHTVDVTTTVRAEDGRVVFTAEEARTSAEWSGRGGFGYSAEIPLRDFAPGLYVLRVDARSRLGGETVAQEIPFRVVAGPRAGGDS